MAFPRFVRSVRSSMSASPEPNGFGITSPKELQGERKAALHEQLADVRAHEEIEAVLAMLQRKGEIFRPEESPVVSPDPADTKFLHYAQAARADFIVTGNKRDFPDAPYGPTRVVSAGELLDRITLEM